MQKQIPSAFSVRPATNLAALGGNLQGAQVEAASGSVAVRKGGALAPNLSISRFGDVCLGHLVLTHLYVGKVFPTMGRLLIECSSVASS